MDGSPSGVDDRTRERNKDRQIKYETEVAVKSPLDPFEPDPGHEKTVSLVSMGDHLGDTPVGRCRTRSKIPVRWEKRDDFHDHGVPCLCGRTLRKRRSVLVLLSVATQVSRVSMVSVPGSRYMDGVERTRDLEPFVQRQRDSPSLPRCKTSFTSS